MKEDTAADSSAQTSGLTSFVAAVKKLEGTLTRAVLSSFVFSTLAVFVQYGHFDKSFLALTELVGGVLGAAGVLSAFLSELHRAMDEADTMLSFNPRPASIRAILGIFMAVACFCAFYWFVRSRNEACLVFLGVGNFVFFRSFAGAVSAIRRSDAQRRLWESMTEEQRLQRLESEETFMRIARGETHPQVEAKQALQTVRETLREIRRDRRRRKYRSFFEWCHRVSIALRRKLAGDLLLTRTEREDRQLAQEEAMKLFENLGRDDCLKLASKVMRGAIKPHTIESLKLQVYEDGGYWLMRIDGDLSSEAVPRVLSVRRNIIENSGTSTLALLLPANAEVSLEAMTSLKKEGVFVLRQDEVAAQPG